MKPEMTIRPDIYSEIEQNIDILHIEPVCKGYSDDKKYLLTTKSEERFLLRITETDDTEVLSGRDVHPDEQTRQIFISGSPFSGMLDLKGCSFLYYDPRVYGR
jgi:hypothetical protein